jgi:hypothetical protein
MDILCGRSVDDCSPYLFAAYIGNNPQSPFIFHINVTDTAFDYNSTLHVTPLNTTTYNCYEPMITPWGNASACGCSDCQPSCPVPGPPPPVILCDIWGVECVNFAALLMFLLFTATFLMTLLIANVFRQSGKSDNILIENGNIYS